MAADKCTVVVVDDDEFMRAYLSETLNAGGYECRTFACAMEALEFLASGGTRADLLLSDVHMPGMSGLDLLRTVKTVLPHLPFILISGSGDLPLAQMALRVGAADYLLKPVRPQDLMALVSRHANSGNLTPSLTSL